MWEPGYAKINVGLAVTGRRANGYHQLSTLFQRLELCDWVGVRPAAAGSPPPSSPVQTSWVPQPTPRYGVWRAAWPGVGQPPPAAGGRPAGIPGSEGLPPAAARVQDMILGAGTVPDDATNLAWRAWQAACEPFGVSPQPWQLLVNKAIPAGAGLGGGSADAAAAWRAAWRWLEGEQRDTEAPGARALAVHLLRAPAGGKVGRPAGADGGHFTTALAQLGADVPFAASSAAAAWGRGVGEELSPLPGRRFPLILIKPAVGAATAEVYRWLDQLADEDPRAEAARREASRARVEQLISCWRQGSPLVAIAAQIGRELPNDLARALYQHVPEVATWREHLAKVVEKSEPGTALYGLTGSGSALFVLADSDSTAQRLWDVLTAAGSSDAKDRGERLPGPALMLWTYSQGEAGLPQVQIG
ncbi:MAG: hypothetical protein IMX01_09220 [Limnochordaceae bacterium]|nr:hypothetical protein [Limnochordaceae bacterium]